MRSPGRTVAPGVTQVMSVRVTSLFTIESVKVGGGGWGGGDGTTTTLALQVTEPPGPVKVPVKVQVPGAVNASSAEPLVPTGVGPWLKPFEPIVPEVAPVELHESVKCSPGARVALLTESVHVGVAGGGGGGGGGVVSPPSPPVSPPSPPASSPPPPPESPPSPPSSPPPPPESPPSPSSAYACMILKESPCCPYETQLKCTAKIAAEAMTTKMGTNMV